jgi:hypothetical protein
MGELLVTKDGASVTKEGELADKYEDMSAEALRASVPSTRSRKPMAVARSGPTREWHVDLRKPKAENDMCKGGLSCKDGGW